MGGGLWGVWGWQGFGARLGGGVVGLQGLVAGVAQGLAGQDALGLLQGAVVHLRSRAGGGAWSQVGAGLACVTWLWSLQKL